MADYYPLISRAVSNMGSSTPEQRRALYERATNALVGQLRNADPPVSEEELERERKALEDAIRRVETEANGGVDREVFAGMLDDAVAEAVAEQRPPPLPAAETPAQPPATPDEAFGEARRVPETPPPAPEKLRPQAPRPQVRERRWVRGAVILGALAIVVALIGVPAYMLRHQPADFAPRPEASVQPSEPDRKVQDRLAGEDAAPSAPQEQTVAGQQAPAPVQAPETPAPSPGPAAQPETAQQNAAPSAPASEPVPVLQRAILVEEPNEGSKELRQTVGRVLWRLDSVPGGVGEPLDAAVRAEVDLSDAGLKAEILIRRNRDAALPASHTIETKFVASDQAANGKVRDVGVPEMRQEEATRGTPLAGIAVPVTENLFLTGLSNLPADVQRNLESLRGRNWFMLPLRFANGRRAVLLFEKGGPGERTIADAIQAWRQG
jgi:hypothetical protein